MLDLIESMNMLDPSCPAEIFELRYIGFWLCDVYCFLQLLLSLGMSKEKDKRSTTPIMLRTLTSWKEATTARFKSGKHSVCTRQEGIRKIS